MRKYIRKSNGQFGGSRPTPKDAPTAIAAATKSERARECRADETNSTALQKLTIAWEHSNRDQSRVVPQRTILVAPTLAEGRELLGTEHTHVQARYVIESDCVEVRERLLRAGYACSVPLPGVGASTATLSAAQEQANPRAQEILEQVEAQGIWRLSEHADRPHTTVAATPHVSNADEGWAYLETGLRHAKGPRFLRPKASILLVGTTPLAPPPPPPAGYVHIKGVRSLLYAR